MLLHKKIYWTEAITKMLCTYELKAFVEKLDSPRVNDDGLTTKDKFCRKTQHKPP